MGFMGRVIFAATLLIAAIIYQNCRQYSSHLPVPKFDFNEYWGPGDKSQYVENKEIVTTRIQFPEEDLKDLKQQLSRKLKLQEPLEGVGFEYGFNSKKLREVLKYWRDNYLPRWRERESFLWSLPHFVTEIQGLSIHYIHTRPNHKNDVKGKKVYPLLLLHGWPGSVREFYDVIPKLSMPNDENDYVFEVVAPSLPGYGWSEGASKPGLGSAQMAIVLRNLMLRLGYNKFFVQGGDWGAIIGSNLATIFPENVIGYHSNMCNVNAPLSNIKYLIVSNFPSFFLEKGTEEFFPSFFEKFQMILEEMGYFHIQATKPDTIGAALSDNPVGLAAYILEKFSTWTDIEFRKLPDGGLERYFTMDALLDNVMIYYLTNSITTSQRLYSEEFNKKQFSLNMGRVPTTVPTGCARFKNDLLHAPDWALRDKFLNLVHSTYHKEGGHFAAMQLPDLFYKDFIEFAKKVDSLEKM